MHHAQWRYGWISNDDEWHDHDDLQHDDGHVQMRDDHEWPDDHLHQRGCSMLQDDPGLLFMHDDDDGMRLYVLHDNERNTRLLRGLLLITPPDLFFLGDSVN